MHETHFQSQFTAAALLEFLLRFLQKWSKTPWITEHTQGITVAFRASLAFFATLGITWKYSGDTHTLVIGGLSAIAIATALWHFAGQYATQHLFGKMLQSGNLDKIKQIVSDAVQLAMANRAQQGMSNPAPQNTAAQKGQITPVGVVVLAAFALAGYVYIGRPIGDAVKKAAHPVCHVVTLGKKCK